MRIRQPPTRVLPASTPCISSLLLGERAALVRAHRRAREGDADRDAVRRLHERVRELPAHLRLGGGAEMTVDRAALVGGEEDTAARRLARERHALAARQRERQRHERRRRGRAAGSTARQSTFRSRSCAASSTPMSQSLRQQAPDCWQVKTTRSGRARRSAWSSRYSARRRRRRSRQAGRRLSVVNPSSWRPETGACPAPCCAGRARRGARVPARRARHPLAAPRRGARPLHERGARVFAPTQGHPRRRPAHLPVVRRRTRATRRRPCTASRAAARGGSTSDGRPGRRASSSWRSRTTSPRARPGRIDVRARCTWRGRHAGR